jgi:hypothetical protein
MHFLETRSSITVRTIIGAGTEALNEALEQSRLKSNKDYDELLLLVYPRIQSLCLTATEWEAPIDRDFHMDRFALAKATHSMKRFSLRQFWRVWLINANFPLNEANKGEDDSAELIVQPTFPPWIEGLSADGTSDPLQYIRNIISNHILAGFTEDLKVCMK